MKVNRKPNCECYLCGEAMYRRPWEIKSKSELFCSRSCFNNYKGLIPNIACSYCGENFKPEKRTTKFCSRKCSNMGRVGIKYTKDSCGNKSRKRLELLKQTFNFDSCMVVGCDYSITYDIHRFVEGKNGGEYVIGNMFAICPNHHAEVTRKIIEFKKVSDCELAVV